MTFLEKAQEIVKKYGSDTEAVHSELDKLMEDILISKGFVDLVNFIREQERWYA